METTEPVREIYLQPGQFCFGKGMLRISTLLGSCISIILWHPLLAHGGMCHYMLPTRKRPRGITVLDGKYGDEAMELFMLELGKRKTTPEQYRVHVYGGGNMFDDHVPDVKDIGRQNIEMGQALLAAYGFVLTDGHFGSFGHRRISFDVWTGEVRLIYVDTRKTGR